MTRAIAASPEIIFFDEPTTGLDPIMAGVINDLIREIVTEMGATAMTITHDMSSVRAIADRVAMLHGGVIRWEGPVAEMDATPDPYVQQFIHGRAEGPSDARQLQDADGPVMGGHGGVDGPSDAREIDDAQGPSTVRAMQDAEGNPVPIAAGSGSRHGVGCSSVKTVCRRPCRQSRNLERLALDAAGWCWDGARARRPGCSRGC